MNFILKLKSTQSNILALELSYGGGRQSGGTSAFYWNRWSGSRRPEISAIANENRWAVSSAVLEERRHSRRSFGCARFVTMSD